MNARHLALASVLLAACTSSDDDSSRTATGSVTAGDDLFVVPVERVSIAPASAGGLRIDWVQDAGPAVDLDVAADGRVTFDAPSFPSVIELRARGLDGGDVIAQDDVRVTVRGARSIVDFEHVASIDLGTDEPTSVTCDEASRPAFVGRADEVAVFDLSDPTAPAAAGALPAPSGGFVSGGIRDVAAGGDIVAVAHDGMPSFEDGRVFLYDATTLAELSSFAVPPRPVELVYAPIFTEPRFALACAADPRPGDATPGAIRDGRGAVVEVTIPAAGAGALDPATDVVTIDFSAFDGQGEPLAQAGVRLPRPEVEVSQDLEPRSIALEQNTRRGTVALPANGAVARVDFESGEVLSLRALPRADFSGEDSPGAASIIDRMAWRSGRPSESYDVGLPAPVSLPSHDLGAVQLTGIHEETISIKALSGRGVTAGVGTIPSGPRVRYFEPDRPHAITSLRVDRASGEWEITDEVELFRGAGIPITGRPNFTPQNTSLTDADEYPIDLEGLDVEADPYGAWFTGMVQGVGGVWMCDARRPSVYRFNHVTGEMLDRFVPEGANSLAGDIGTETLPATYANVFRDVSARYFGGFHGIANSPLGGLALITGAPLDNPRSGFGSNSQQSRIVRILIIHPQTGAPMQEYCVVLDAVRRRFEDLALIDGALHAVQTGSCGGGRALVRFDLAGATDLLALGANRPAVDAGLETTDPADLATAFAVPIVPVQQTTVADLTIAGLSDAGDVSIASTDVFGTPGDGSIFYAVSDAHRVYEPSSVGAPAETSTVPCSQFYDGSVRASVGTFRLTPRSFDPSNLDGGLELRHYPVSAYRQITRLVTGAFSVDDAFTYGFDGGLARSLPGLFEESVDAFDLVVDTTVFTDPGTLLADEAIGRLRVSATDGDDDGDGLVESIRALGGRGMLTLGPDLRTVRDSGHSITRALIDRRPDLAARFDATSPTAGVAPSAATMVGRGYLLAVAYGESGTVALFDPSVQEAPILAGLLDLAPGARPVDLAAFEWPVAPGDFRLVVCALDAEGRTLDVFSYRLY